MMRTFRDWLLGRTARQRQKKAVAARQWQEAKADFANTVGEPGGLGDALARTGGTIFRVVFWLFALALVVGFLLAVA